jgi:hypothetical protein
LKDKFSIGFAIDFTQNLKGFLLDASALIAIVVILNAFPYLCIFIILQEHFLHDIANDQSRGRVEVAIEEQYFIMCLLFDLLR